MCFLLLVVNAISGCDSVSNRQKKAFQTLEKKTGKLTDMRDFGEFSSLSLNTLLWLPLFSSFALCTRRTNELQVSMNCDMKYLQKRIGLEIDCHQLGCFSFWSAQSELSNICLEVSMCAITNWNWIEHRRFEFLRRIHVKFVSGRCYCWIDEV